MLTRLVKKWGSFKDFKYHLAEATKTGKSDNIMNTIQSQLEIMGLKSFIFSPRHVR